MKEIFLIYLGASVFFFGYVGAITLYNDWKAQKKEERKLNKWPAIIGGPCALAFLVLDFLMQITVFTVLFLDIPRDWLVTGRLERHHHDKGFRGNLSRWIAHKLLDPFDHPCHVCADGEHDH